jgi:hypothetical protein
MGRIFSKGGAVVALIVILAAPAVYADDPPAWTDPPKVRIGPPIGAPTQEAPPTFVELLWAWLYVRIGPPIG